jgi:hypothetical protein
MAVVAPAWRYATPDGTANAQDIAIPQQTGGFNPVFVTVGGDGQWPVTASGGHAADICVLAPLGQFGLDPVSGSGAGLSATTYAGTPPAAGCAIQIRAAQDDPTQPVAIVLCHFGVQLAVNVRAHQLYPTPPPATPAEQALAQQLIASQ